MESQYDNLSPLHCSLDNSSLLLSGEDPNPIPSLGPLYVLDQENPLSESSPSIPTEIMVPAKKRRQPAAKSEISDEQQQRKALRAKKNRQFARESRIRKLQYFAGLEKEVDVLRKELADCKSRLAEYKLIERQRAIAGDKGYELISSTFPKMGQGDISGLSRKIIHEMDRLIEERRVAMEQLSRMMFRVAVPISSRIVMWRAEHDIDIFSAESVGKAMGYRADGEEVKAVMANLQAMYHDQETYDQMRAAMQSITQNIRKGARQLVEGQRQMQVETMKIWQFVKAKLIPRLERNRAAANALKHMPKFEGNPELSDAVLLQVGKQDFSIGSEATISNSEDEERGKDLGRSHGSDDGEEVKRK